MDQGLESKRKFKSTVASVKRINDDPKALSVNTYDSFKEDLSLKGNATRKTINDFTSKQKGRVQNKKNVFADLLDTVDGFLGTEKEDPVNTKRNPDVRSKTLRYAKQSAQKTLLSAKEVISRELKKGCFSGQGSCNPDDEPLSFYSISPKDFDFVNMLKVDPDSISGKVMYESQPDPNLGVQFNRELYTAFDETPYAFNTNDGNGLFTMAWTPSTQRYNISVSGGTSIADFIDDYYSTIELPNIGDVMKNAMLQTLQGDGSEGSSFNQGMDYMDRLLTKLFSLCGNADPDKSPFLKTTEQLNEDEGDLRDYFNFDDVEGIDLDDEDARHRRVLKFTDCNNFEIPTNSNHMEDFAYLLDTKNIDENVNNTLKKAAVDAYEQSDNSIYLGGFDLSIMTSYVQKLPKALISTVLSPKMMFPMSLSYRMVYGEELEVKDLMRELSTTFYNIIKTLFWTFIREFWRLIKKDLLAFVRDTATTILLNKVTKIKSIILSLISLLLKVLDGGIQSCAEIFDTLLKVIQAALNRSVKIPIPGLLLVLSQSLPGFSADRAYMDALQRMENSGINTGDIYGSPNTLPTHVKSIIDAYSSEMDSNSYIKIALNPTTIPAGPGGAVISPLITGAGKLI